MTIRRYALRNDQWERIKDLLPGRDGYVEGTAKDNRLLDGADEFLPKLVAGTMLANKAYDADKRCLSRSKSRGKRW